MNTPVTRDIGQGLMADLWGSTGPDGISILAFHGGGGINRDPAMMAPFLGQLAAVGPVSVAEPRYRTLNRDRVGLQEMRADAAQALAWAQARLAPGTQLFVMGISFGAFLALDAVVHAPEPVQQAVTGLILISPIVDTGPKGFANRVLSPDDHAALSPLRLYDGHPLTARLRCLVAHGGRDQAVPVATARRFAALWPEGRCDFHEFSGGGHGFFNKPPHDAAVARHVLRFLGLPTKLLKPVSTPAVARRSARLPEGACMVYGIGAQKAGTSWLYDCLTQSPECHKLPTKEMHYFDVLYQKGETGHLNGRLALLRKTVEGLIEGVAPENNRPLGRARILVDQLSIHATTPGDHRAYVRYLLMGYTGQRLLCDFTPSYSMLNSDAFAEMDSIGPARFIFVMRDPVERFWSQIRMLISAQNPTLSDTEYLEKCVSHARNLCSQHNPARIPRADYARTMAALEAVVPAERIHYAFYEELFTQDSLDRICAFLGIAPVTVESDKRVNLGRSSSLPPDIAALLEKGLAPQYAAVAARFGDAVPASWRMGKAGDGGRESTAAHVNRGD